MYFECNADSEPLTIGPDPRTKSVEIKKVIN